MITNYQEDKKYVRLLLPDELPEPFRTYWSSEGRVNREYEFFNVNDELYILEKGDDLMHHWTNDSCAGICCFMDDNGIKERRDMPYVTVDGTYLFEVIPSDDYETSARDPVSGRQFVVCAG